MTALKGSAFALVLMSQLADGSQHKPVWANENKNPQWNNIFRIAQIAS
jgi:hypothetical protein